MVASAEPADHVRLAAHFSALADQYTVQAVRHESMAGNFMGTSRLQLDASMAAHCRQLAQIDIGSAVTLLELAKYHAQLGRGTTSAVPANGTRFHTGEGSTPPSADDVRALVTDAKTPTEHRVLTDYFTILAARYAATEVEHAGMANSYRGTKLTNGAAHCDRLVKLSREGAKEARAAAALHSQLAEMSR